MTKTFNFASKNNSNNDYIFLDKSFTPDYSTMLDDIIATDVIKKNKYLFNSIDNTTPIILTGSSLKDSDDFTKATKFLANYKKYKKTYNIPYIIGKMYTLFDGTPIVFYDDEIQIGFDTYKYSKFTNLSFLNNLTANTKKIIINIYTNGIKDIEINIR